jgi:chitodextrinase
MMNKKIYKLSILLIVLALSLAPVAQFSQSVFAQSTDCITTIPDSGAYSATVCFVAPANGSNLTGDSAVTATVSISGTSPGIRRVIFYLNNIYLLTDYESPYTFVVPTTEWVDGTYALSVEALLRDGIVTDRPVISVNFQNGIYSPPYNSNHFSPSTGTSGGSSFTVAATGDGAGGESSAAAVSDLAVSLQPDLFLYLGDVYEKGSVAEFYNWYGTDSTNFGRLRSITNPVIGNHEYENLVAPGYFNYWDNIPNFYSYDAGGWHFIALNSNAAYEPTDPTSAQYQWLEQNLAANSQSCTIVYYHHPYFNIGPEGSASAMADIWALMSQYNVSIVLNGHDHNYQRWIPLDANGQPSSTGITEFVLGGGGHGIRPFVTSDSRVAYSSDINPTAFGVLLLTLNQDGASFSYKNSAGATIDSGVVPCVTAAGDTASPTTPGNFSATAVSATRVDMTWSASSDNSGVSGYTIFRDNAELATVSGASLAYSDTTAYPATSYTYAVDAYDQAGNHSTVSDPVALTTPEMPTSLTFPVSADTYVNAYNPTYTYGTATVLRADSSPDLHSYLRFDVSGLAGTPITSAWLQVYAASSTSVGVSLHAVADNSWDEYNTNYDNAPPLGAILAASGPFSTGEWISLDITGYVTGEGTFSFGLDTTSTTSISFPSRESGANAAQLIVNFQEPVDTTAPSIPDGLTATAASSTQVDLAWNASTDDSGVAGYTIYRDGAELVSVSGVTTSYSDTTALPSTSYAYTVDAFDQAGNRSAQSPPVSITTPTLPSSLAFDVVADTYVNAQYPTATYGSTTVLRVDASPDLNGYLRFIVSGLAGTSINSVQLLIYANNSSSLGIDVYEVADNTWSEANTNYNNAPPFGNLLASSGAFVSGNWIILDVTSFVMGEGTFSFGIDTTSNTALTFPARESGANAAQLVVNFQSQTDTTPPSVPDGLNATVVSSSQVDLTWNASTDDTSVTGYTIYRDGNQLDTVPASTLTYSDSTLSPGNTYTYTVDAFDQAGNHSAQSLPVGITTLDEPPTVPTGLSATAVSGTQVDLAWDASTDNSIVAGYTIYRDGIEVGAVDGITLTYIDTTVQPAVTYSYSVDAFDDTGSHSQPSTAVSVTTLDTLPPSVPDGLTATSISALQVDLVWNAATDNVGVSGYTIYRDGAELTSLTDGSLTYSDISVVPATGYSYTVDAFDLAGNHSAQSAPLDITTPDQAPTVPSGLTAIAISDTQVDLHWDASTDNTTVAGYTIYRDGVVLAVVSGTTLTYSDSSVTSAVTYTYSVDAYDDAGNYSAQSDPVSVTTPDTVAPSAPANLKAVIIGESQVYLSWDAASDNVGVMGYAIYRNGTALADLAGTALTFNDTNASPATSYTYVVDAYDQAGNHSIASNAAEVITPEQSVAFTVTQDTYVDASNPRAKHGNDSNLQVDASPEMNAYLAFDVSGLSGLQITKAELLVYASGSTNLGIDALQVLDNAWSEKTTRYDNAPALGELLSSSGTYRSGEWIALDVTGYITGTGTYSFGITTSSTTMLSFPSRESGANAAQLVLFLSSGTDTTPPSIPDGLNATAISATQVDLSWNASSDNMGVTGYTIYRDGVELTGVSGSTLTFSDTGVSAATSYTYTVDAFDQAGNHSVQSAPVTVSTPDEPPSVPTGLAADASSGTQVDLSWNASTDNNVVAGYTIYRDGNTLASVSGTTLAYTDPTVQTGVTYSYSLDAYDDAGNHSAQSAPVNVTIPDQPPSTPTGLTANAVSATQVDLAWNASTDNTVVSGYTIYRDGNVLTTVAGNILTYSDATVQSGLTYSYAVDAFDGGGNHSGLSDSVSVTTPDVIPPTVPDGLTANASSATQVDLGWNAATDNAGISGYTIYRDGAELATVSGTTQSYSDTSVSPATTYSYSVDAFDLAGNHSDPSTAVSVTTLDSSMTFNVAEDTYVDASNTKTKYGRDSVLNVNASPEMDTYLQFNVSGLSGMQITRARLFIYTGSSSSTGFDVHEVLDNNWSEKTIRFDNAPAMGSVLASSGSFKSGDWIILDVTNFVSGEGVFSFGVTTTSTTILSFASKESGANSAKLVLDLK